MRLDRRVLPYLLGLALCAAGASGCEAVFPPEPPPGTILFPVAVELVPAQAADGAPPFLLLANSNYDARWAQGTLQSYDLDAIASAVDACASPPCTETDALPFLVDEVQIGPQVHSIALSPRGDRVYLAIRSEADLTWVDLGAEGQLDCEGAPTEGIERCAPRRRTTPVATTCGREPSLVGDVAGLATGSIESLTGEPADASLDWVLMVHRNGRASLFVDRPAGGASVPTLVHVLTGIPTDATNAAFDASRNLVWMTLTVPPGGTVPMRTPIREIPLLGVAYDRDEPECSEAFSAGRFAIRGTDDGLDSRDVAFSEGGRFAHVLSRRSEAIVTLDTEGEPIFSGETLIRSVTAMPFGPARIAAGTFDGRELLAVTSFDGQRVTFVDAATGDIVGVPVPGVQRPQDVVIDGVRGLAYVADFGDSVLRVIDLRPLREGREIRVVLTLGRITPIRTF
jgi:hypothetical protein